MALLFDGSTSYIDCGDVLEIDSGDNATISVWVNRNANGVRHEIISKEGATAVGWEISVLGSNVAEVGFFDGVSYFVVQSTTLINAGTTYHIVGVLDNDNDEIRIYINGVLEDTLALFGDTGSTSTENLNIGRRPNNTRYFNGYIEDLRVYNIAYSDLEILSIYNQEGRDDIYDGLVARWKMMEQPPGTDIGGVSDISNIQSLEQSGPSTDTISISYTVPVGVTNPVLVVSAGGEDATIANTEPASAVFGVTGMTRRAWVQTTSGFGGGSAIFTLGVSAGDSGTITVTYAGNVGGRIIQAYTVIDATDTVDVIDEDFNNSGNITGSFTTTTTNNIGLTHVFIGNTQTPTGTTGTDHVLNQAVDDGDLAGGYQSIIGSFPAAAIQSYNSYGFTFDAAPNRAAISMIALAKTVDPTAYIVPDYSDVGYDGTPSGNLTYQENIAIR